MWLKPTNHIHCLQIYVVKLIIPLAFLFQKNVYNSLLIN